MRSASRPRRRFLKQLRETFLGSQVERTHRHTLIVEPLEARNLLAADVLVEAIDLPVFHQDTDVAIADSPSSTNEDRAEGEAAPDLVAFAKALNEAGHVFYGASWCPHCTAMKELFEDGQEYLPFVEVTDLKNPNFARNQVGIDNGIESYPTWVFFPDTAQETRLEGEQSLAAISAAAGIPIPQSSSPSMLPIPDQINGNSVLGGAPSYIALDGYDPNGSEITYEVETNVTSGNLNLEASVIQNNPSILFDIAGWGKMTFQLFAQRASAITDHIIQLAQAGVYNNTSFHRVIDGFMMQGGDPTGTGSGDPSIPAFDDFFHPELQHVNTGMLSMAKSIDDSNSSQFFILDSENPAPRHLDGNHSVFGMLTEGDKNREAMIETAVSGTNPVNDLRITSSPFFNDTENAVLMLKAGEGESGTATVSVTATDAEGLTATQTFNITVVPDGANMGPYLNDAGLMGISTTVNSDATFTITSTDIEGDAVVYSGEIPSNLNLQTLLGVAEAATVSRNYTFNVDATTGAARVTPPADFIGTLGFYARVTSLDPSDTLDEFDKQLVLIDVNPLAPTGVDLTAASDSGAKNNDNVTQDGTLTFQVSGVRDGALVTLRAGGSDVGQGTASGDSVTISTANIGALGDGVHSITAVQTVNGQTSAASPPLSITLDTTAPVALTSTPPTSAIVGMPVTYDAQHPEEGDVDFTYSLSGAPANASINAATGVLNWTPTAEQSGTQTFSVDVEDAAGNMTSQSLSVDVMNAADFAFTLQVTDNENQTITNVDIGDSFLVHVFVQDTRDQSTLPASQGGLFTAYVDLLYDSDRVSVQGSTVNFGGTYSNSKEFAVSTAGIVDDTGAFAGTSPLGGGNILVFSVPMRANVSGTATFNLDPADDVGHDILAYGENAVVSSDRISYGSVSLEVNSPAFAARDETNVDEDSSNNIINVLSNDDPNNLAVGNLRITSVSTPSSGGTVTINRNGTPNDPTDDFLNYTPLANFSETETFTYTVEDEVGSTDTATVEVQVQPSNDAPVANDDAPAVKQDETVAQFLDVLDNDTDLDGDTLAVQSISTTSNGGVATIAPNGTHVNYTPAAGFSGTETFTYVVTDGNGGTDSATVEVSVQPEVPPPNAQDDTATVQEDSLTNVINLLTNDETGSSGLEIMLQSFTPKTTANGGTVELLSDTTGTVDYRPAANFTGVDTFTYTITNGQATDTATVSVTVNNVQDAPVAADDTFHVEKNAAATTLDVLENDTDLDPDDTLTITNVSAGNQGGTITRINNNTAISYQPVADFTGTETFTYTISDGTATDTATVTVNVRDFVPGNLRGHVFIDANKNGRIDAGESRLGGVTITATGPSDGPVPSATMTVKTDSTGTYLFADMAPGSYTITQSQPSFTVDGQAIMGSAGGTSTTSNSFTVTVGEGQTVENYDFTEFSVAREVLTLRDFALYKPDHSVIVTTDAGNNPTSIRLSSEWSDITEASATVDADGTSVDIVVTDVNNDQFMFTANTAFNHQGEDGSRYLRLQGGRSSFNLLPVTTNNGAEAEGEADSSIAPAITSTVSADLAEGEAEPLDIMLFESESPVSLSANSNETDEVSQRTLAVDAFMTTADSSSLLEDSVYFTPASKGLPSEGHEEATDQAIEEFVAEEAPADA